MYDELKEEFIHAMFRLKKMPCIPTVDDAGLKMSEMIVLQRLADNTDERTDWMDDVREDLCVSKPAISHILNSLEKKGRVVREIDKNDRRKIVIRLTDEGRRIVDVVRKRLYNMTDELISRFGGENAKQFIRLVNRFSDVCADINFEDLEKGDEVID